MACSGCGFGNSKMFFPNLYWLAVFFIMLAAGLFVPLIILKIYNLIFAKTNSENKLKKFIALLIGA